MKKLILLGLCLSWLCSRAQNPPSLNDALNDGSIENPKLGIILDPILMTSGFLPVSASLKLTGTLTAEAGIGPQFAWGKSSPNLIEKMRDATPDWEQIDAAHQPAFSFGYRLSLRMNYAQRVLKGFRLSPEFNSRVYLYRDGNRITCNQIQLSWSLLRPFGSRMFGEVYFAPAWRMYSSTGELATLLAAKDRSFLCWVAGIRLGIYLF